jgi:hypothetical protein
LAGLGATWPPKAISPYFFTTSAASGFWIGFSMIADELVALDIVLASPGS